MPESKSASPGPVVQPFLAVQIGRDVHLIPFLRVAEVKSLEQAMPVFSPPDYTGGFVLLHGRVVPVVDLRARFGVPARFEPATRLVVAWLAGDAVHALVVDGVTEVSSVSREKIQAAPACGRLGAFIQGIVTTQGGPRLILDLDHL